MAEDLGDRELMNLARQGYKEAFCCLFECYQALEGRIALRIVGAEDIVQDLVQKAMLQVFL